MAKNIKILKVGGGVFTQKRSKGWVRLDIIEKLASEIAEYVTKKDKDKASLVLAFGTGSCGHQPAKKYNVLQEFNPMGTVETYKSVTKLSSVILKTLNKHNVNAMPIDIMSCVVAQQGRIKHMCVEPLQMLIENGFVPIILGNVVMDVDTKVTIVSSDQIATYLAKKLDACTLGFGSKEDGVYGESKKLINEINTQNFDSFKEYIGQSEYPDVTNGMLGKVYEILQGSPMPACIFNASQEGNILRFLHGEQLGTKIVPFGAKE